MFGHGHRRKISSDLYTFEHIATGLLSFIHGTNQYVYFWNSILCFVHFGRNPFCSQTIFVYGVNVNVCYSFFLLCRIAIAWDIVQRVLYRGSDEAGSCVNVLSVFFPVKCFYHAVDKLFAKHPLRTFAVYKQNLGVMKKCLFTRRRRRWCAGQSVNEQACEWKTWISSTNCGGALQRQFGNWRERECGTLLAALGGSERHRVRRVQLISKLLCLAEPFAGHGAVVQKNCSNN